MGRWPEVEEWQEQTNKGTRKGKGRNTSKMLPTCMDVIKKQQLLSFFQVKNKLWTLCVAVTSTEVKKMNIVSEAVVGGGVGGFSDVWYDVYSTHRLRRPT